MDDNYLASQIFGSAKRLALFVALVAVFLNIGVGVAWLALARIERQKPNFVASQANLPASTDQNSPIGIQSQKLTVNAQLQVNGQFYLAPSTLPADAKAGTIVFDQNTNTLQYYNGTTFNAVAAQASIPQAAVASVQGQTGAISFVPGTGIAINGTTISGSGILGVNGVGGTINVTTANGIASLSLPQNIAPSATPTFAGITLSGITVTEFEGRGLDSSSGILGVRLQALNQGGLQLDGSGNLSLLTSCNPSDILKFIANAWVCDQDQGGASSPSLQGAYNNYGGVVQAIINLNDNQKGIRIRDSASPITASSLFAIQSSAGTNYLDVTPTTTTVGTDLVVTSGNDFTVNGAVSINTTTGGTTIGNSSSNFQLDSNALDVSTAGALSGITGYSQASGNFGITGTGTFTTGTGAIALQGTVTVGTGSAAGRLLLTDGSGNTATLRTAGGSLAQSTTYSLPSVAGALNNTASVCVLYGGGGSNCFGAGGGIAGTGTPNQIPLFDTAGSIADSSLTDVSGAVTGTGSLSIQGSGGISVGNTSTRGLLRFNDANAANNYVGIQGPATTTGYTLTLPTGPAAAAGYCLKDNDGAGGLVWGACLGASGPTPDLAGVYAASTTGGVLASVTLNSTSQGIYLKDAATPISGDLFNVQSNNGLTKYLAVTPTSTTVQNFTVTTGRTLTVNGDAITDLTGNGLEVNTNALSIKLNEATLGYSGLNLSSSGVKLKDCSDQQVLKFITATNWTCAADNGAGPGINLQEAYTNFTGPDDATITIDTSSLGLRIRDTSTPQGVSAPVFAVQNNNSSSNYLFVNSTNFNVGVATSTFSGNATIQGGTLSLGTASVAGSLFLHNASVGANGITLSAGGSSNYSLTLPAGAGSANNCLKKDPSNTTQLVWDACLGGSGGAGGDVINGGNSFGTAMTLGTNDANALNFETAGNTKLTIDTAGNLSLANNAAKTLSIAQSGAGTNGRNLTIAAGTVGTGGSASGSLYLQAGGNGGNAGLGGGAVFIQGGAAGASAGSGGSVYIDSGSFGGGGIGTILLGSVNRSWITVGNNGNGNSTLNHIIYVGNMYTTTNVQGDTLSIAATQNITLSPGATSSVRVGSIGTATGQLYVGGRVPTAATGSVSTGIQPLSVYVQGHYAYFVNKNSSTLQILDVSNPASPTSVGTVATAPNPSSVYVQGRYAYIINQVNFTLQIFDVSNPASPVIVGTVSTGASPASVYVQGRYAYVLNGGSNTLQILDVSNPASPVSVGTVATSSSPNGVYVQGRYAYVSNGGSSTLQIFDVSNPASPVSVGTVATGSSPNSVYVQGRYAYVANYNSNTLQIFDVSNPASPTSVGTIGTGINPFSVYVQGRYAYVANRNSNTLQIFDVSNPASPTSVGTIGTGINPFSVYVQGRYAYVANYGASTLQIFDLGGAYIQQLEVGGVETGTLQTRGNATINGDQAVVGGLTVGQSLQMSGNLGVSSSTASVLNRPTDGKFLSFTVGATGEIGSIGSVGGNVTLTAFTGSHLGLFDGTTAGQYQLVDLTGNNQYKQGSPEPFYGITKTALANSPNVLGSYLGRFDPSTPASLDNPELIMAAGNGDVWIADNGSGNVMIGDPLISSGDVPGHAMRDTKQFPTSHIFAKSAEAIDWDTITTTVGGTKVAKVTVLFSYYNQDNQNTLAQDLQGGSLNITGNSILIGNLSVIGNINVSGTTTLATLIVTGNVTIQQNLTVEGNTTIAGNLTVGGKIITSGATPAAVLGAASGTGASYTIEGNDTAGSITVVTGSSVNTGEQVVVSFASNFTASPRVSLTPATLAASTVDYYVTKDTTGFKLYFSSSPTPGQTYTFDYQILQ